MNPPRKVRVGPALPLVALAAIGCLSHATPTPSPAPATAVQTTTVAPASKPEPATWLVLSDIHFNPFDDPSLVDALAAAPADQWGAIFQTAGVKAPSRYGSDPNYALWKSTLAAMQQAVPSPAVVLIGGDFLSHGFQQVFQATAKDDGESAYEAFVDKTVAFLALELNQAFPQAQFVPAVGNNDSYCGDYAPAQGSPFFAHMAAAWEPLVNRRQAAPDFLSSFSSGGYYSARIGDSSVRIVVTNSVYWSVKYSDRCAAPGSHPSQDELAWLTGLFASGVAPPTFMLTHMPPGMDGRSSSVKNKAVAFYEPEAAATLLKLIDNPANNVRLVVAGHTHSGSFRLSQPGAAAGDVPMWLLPAVSPIFKNNPGFIVAKFSPSASEIVDYTAYDLDDSRGGTQAWRTEYQFSSMYGADGLTGEALSKVRLKLASDPALRARFEASYVADSPVGAIDETSWHAYWCALGSMTTAEIQACLAEKAGP